MEQTLVVVKLDPKMNQKLFFKNEIRGLPRVKSIFITYNSPNVVFVIFEYPRTEIISEVVNKIGTIQGVISVEEFPILCVLQV